MIRKILRILTIGERRQLVVEMMLDIFISVADIVFLTLLLLLISHYTDGTGRAGKLSFLSPWLNRKNPVLLITGFFLLFSLKNLLGYFIFRAQSRYLLGVATRISRNRLLKYLEGSYMNYINVDTSVHIREISYHPREFSQHILGGIQHIFTQSLLIVLAITGIALFNAKLFVLLLLLLLPPVIAVFYFLRKRLRSIRVVARSSSEKYLQHLHEALTGFIEGNIYHKQEALLERYIGVQRQFNESVADQLIILGIPNRLIEVFAIFGLVIIVALGSLSGNMDHTTVLTIGVFMAAAYKIIPGIVKIMNAIGQIHTYAFTVDNLIGELKDTSRTDKGMPVAPIRSISCSQLQFSYNGHPVVDRQDLDIKAGSFIGISGTSGKGKSTLLNLLLGFLTPDSGDIYINDSITDAAARRQYWSRIAYVKQQPFLLHDTILHNITLGGESADQDKLLYAANQAGLLPLVDSFPEKWNKIIAENGKNISGGQRQRIAFARALYKDADLLILDEPFSELDADSERALMDLCLRLTGQGKTILLITHNKKNLFLCHKTIVLDEA